MTTYDTRTQRGWAATQGTKSDNDTTGPYYYELLSKPGRPMKLSKLYSFIYYIIPKCTLVNFYPLPAHYVLSNLETGFALGSCDSAAWLQDDAGSVT